MNKLEIKFEDMPQILNQLMEMFKDMSIKVENINNKVNEMPRKPLTIEAAGSIICKGKSTIYKLVAANEIPFHKKGRRLYFYEDGLLEMVALGHLKASKISSRLSFIKWSDIESMLDNKPYETRQTKPTTPITEFYTTAEVKEKYNVVDSWIFVVAKRHNIPRTFNRGKTYWSKKHIDNYFSKRAANPEITEWYTVQEIQDNFDMTLAAIYTLASKNAIPKKKEGKTVGYSKKHFDIAKGIAQPDEPQYYTVAEAMAKFKLTRDQLYHYAKYHNIPRVKVGKYVKISQPELYSLLGDQKIE